MKALSETMGVSRSRQYEKRHEGPKVRSRHYRRAEDDRYLALIREIIEVRSTCGYRRVTVFLNRLLTRLGEPTVNPKRVYRLMKMGSLLLQRSTGRPQRVHNGTIMMNRSNRRWCSDAFEIACWSKERLRVAFSLDCCDREILSYAATTGGIDGNMIRDLMVESMEARFGSIDRLPEPIEWLSDNGPAYISKETVAFAESVGFEVCTTPFYSPESNGMAEAFVKTFKRDYVHANPLYTARFVLEQLPKWFEDYNEQAPHKGLKMKTPREFRRLAAKLGECPVK
jgi:transposase InsO family protein